MPALGSQGADHILPDSCVQGSRHGYLQHLPLHPVPWWEALGRGDWRILGDKGARVGRWWWQGFVEDPESWGRGVRRGMLTYAWERAVAGLERKKSYWELSQASLMKWNKKDFPQEHLRITVSSLWHL